MIRLEQILTPSRCQVNALGGSKKRVLEQIAALIVSNCPQLDEDTLYENLIARERLGSTGFGDGIAIPHCRMEGCSTPISALLQLETAVDFDAIDGEPVDLFFVLLVPDDATDQHLELLRQVAQLLNQPEVCEQLRSASSSQALYQTVINAQSLLEV
ncbi:PTS IIA-like nitrogen regulatory protein PtsN [Thiopseudomonas alkaliphila]|uniref:PTS IIA-like nitrogen regulatory protein PtsN n=1 Tax=Thiopseudomonas alkaliphila TaxID=1697053 RepID=A0AAW7DPT3_9GAMM|nr:PTS IIA-like nitrogen regulatory protein PtsN [Thiopseudomonas alkaliphila]MDM1695193.1 PTS IIA-like nitrogen regulatory protein PtsN [Thiopseudomonas alkaliphila]